MKREKKKSPARRNKNQLSLDFTANVPIEIHIPRQEIKNPPNDFTWERKTAIQLMRS